MLTKLISIFIAVAIPVILLGGGPGKSAYVFKVDIPNTISDIKIQFEIKQMNRLHEGKFVKIYCLCADITNQNNSPKRILVRYHCQGEAREKQIEIEGSQQRIILVDKYIIEVESPMNIKELFSHVLLEYSQ